MESPFRQSASRFAASRRHPRASFVALLLALAAVATDGYAAAVAVGAQATAVDSAQVIAAIDQGHFREAETAIARALAGATVSDAQRAELEFQRERMRRIRLDFTLNGAQAKARLRASIPDLRDEEFAAWDAAGLLEHLDIDGSRYYFKRAPSNLFLLSAQAAARRAQPKPPSIGPNERLNAHHREVVDAARAQHSSSVAPRRLRVTQSLSVHADAVPAGETVKAWIPYPRAIAGQQEDIRWLGSVPTGGAIAPESAPQRTVHLQAKAVKGKPTAFSISYELTVYARHFDLDPDKVVPALASAELAPYLSERPPHVVFTPALREFSRQVVGEEKNPYRIARKLFAAVDRIPWAGAREYSTISNISDYALHAGHADCGQQTLLLMTLLRMNGIPARWQSGWVFSDDAVGYDNMHDWGWLYLAPYGWVPMDVTTGALDSDEPALRDFYFGGLDAYRIAFNDDYAQLLLPAKTFFRSETVDSQRGEAEWRGGNLYFDQWDYDFDWRMLPMAGQ